MTLRPAPIGRVLASALILLLILTTSIWGALALWYRFPATQGMVLLVVSIWVAWSIGIAVVFIRSYRSAALLYALSIIVLMIWWVNIPASNGRNWADDVAMMTTGAVDPANPALVELTNVRNFEWRTETDYTPRWVTRTYDLRHLASVDLLLSYWSGPAIAHTLVSFGFDDGQFVTFSVEIRKEKGETFSEIGGFFKEFETSVIAADERDIVRVRTNVRGEDVYLYRIGLPREAMRSLFLAYVEEANALTTQPRFYNTVTANCTTIVYEMVKRIVPGLPIDRRLLFSGYLPGYIHDVGGLQRGFALSDLRALGRITDRAKAADHDPAFSTLIRRGVPGTDGP